MKKILVIRFSSIGDIVLTTPVIRSLKEQLKCEIHTLTKKRYHNIYKDNKHIDRVYAFGKSTSEVYADLKKENYDFVVDLQKNFRSLKLTQKLKVPHASFPKLNVEKWLLVNFKINKLPHKHIVERYFEAVKDLNVSIDKKGLEFYLPKKYVVKPSILNEKLEKGFISIVIGGQHFTKIMPPEKIASIASQLSLPVVLLGGPEDKSRGEEVIKLSERNLIINACGQFSLNGSASLIKQSSLVITNDTGLMHIAAAFERPIISLWGNTIPEFGMYPYMPTKKDNFVISEVGGLKCRPCSKLGHEKCPKGHFKCMYKQDDNFIIKSASKLLYQKK
ncbi:MAG: glycosyl transferase [Marinilabiliales bacterium]|nr:MAG: glycosyl transferase [Marinilabiliales bacterium]